MDLGTTELSTMDLITTDLTTTNLTTTDLTTTDLTTTDLTIMVVMGRTEGNGVSSVVTPLATCKVMFGARRGSRPMFESATSSKWRPSSTQRWSKPSPQRRSRSARPSQKTSSNANIASLNFGKAPAKLLRPPVGLFAVRGFA
jgi:hypothetical protein